MNDEPKPTEELDQPAESAGTSDQPTDLQTKCDEYLAGWKRALADYENIKKDITRITNEEKARVVRRLTEGMLDVVSNFDLATRHKPDLTEIPDDKKKKIEQWEQGILHIQKALRDTLKDFSVEGYEPMIGDRFDEQLHEAVGTRKDERYDSGMIVEVVNLGWKIGNANVRPARVIVNEK